MGIFSLRKVVEKKHILNVENKKNESRTKVYKNYVEKCKKMNEVK